MHNLTAIQISQAYRRGDFNPVELVEHLLARIQKYDGAYNAFLEVAKESALRDAQQAWREMKAGENKGVLHGVPFAVKDNFDVAGSVTTCHSAASTKDAAQADATAVSRLKAGGAVYLGKLALHEYAFGAPTFDTPYPPARNPWNREHQPGGSSSGSGAAVSAGFIPLALGTDTGGSVRNPAACCGVVGLKPTYDLIPRDGVYPLAFTLDHVGPLARSVDDIAAVLDTLQVAENGRPYLQPAPESLKGKRIGFIRRFHEEDLSAHPDMTQALNDAAEVFAELGATVETVSVPALSEFVNIQRIIIAAEAWAVHGQGMTQSPQLYSKALRTKAMVGAFLSATDYLKAQQARRGLCDSINQLFNVYDALLVVNSLDPACRIDDMDEVNRAYRRQARVPFSLTGHPAISIPCGLSSTGLPLSFQLVSNFFQESELFSMGAAYQAATDWHMKHPELVSSIEQAAT